MVIFGFLFFILFFLFDFGNDMDDFNEDGNEVWCGKFEEVIVYFIICFL